VQWCIDMHAGGHVCELRMQGTPPYINKLLLTH
jgi:hypothetical protein